MKKLTFTQKEMMKLAEVFLWAEAMDYTVGLVGEEKRLKKTEYNLPRLVEKGALLAVRHGKKLVYTIPNKRTKYSADIDHGLICTKSLLKVLSTSQGEVVSERFFRKMKFGVVPEWAIIFPLRTILLFEYSTADNFRRQRLMKSKVRKYKQAYERFESYFEVKAIVLFVFDAPKHEVKRFVEEQRNGKELFYFTDLDSFMTVEGNVLSEPIYFWGGDGKRYPLK